jgi:hypothetical protein
MDVANDSETKHDIECDLKYSLTDQIPLIEKLSDLYSPELYDGPEIFHEVKIGGSYRRLVLPSYESAIKDPIVF